MVPSPLHATPPYVPSGKCGHTGPSSPTLRLFVVTWPTADAPSGFFALFHGPSLRPTDYGRTTGSTLIDAQWSALLSGLAHVSAFPRTCPLRIFLPNRALLPHFTSLHKHQHLPQTVQFVELLDDFITESSPTEVRLFSPRWKNMPYALSLAASETTPPPTATPPSQRERAFLQWSTDYDSEILPRRRAAWISITRPQGNTPPPFTCGALTHRNRRYFAACMQLATRHCFDAGYSLKFQTNAGDEVCCPCNFSQHLDGSAVSSGPMRGRTGTEAGSQGNAGGRTLDFNTLQRQFLDPNDDGGDPVDSPLHPPTTPTLYKYRHVLTDCPQTATQQQKFLRDSTIGEIFSLELGGARLCRFLHFMQALLRPLLPRPDPP